MASYRGHLAFASALGGAYGGAAYWYWNLDWGPAILAVGLTTLGGLLPDLDSDSGVPVRELFNLAAAVTPFLMFQQIRDKGLTPEQTLVILAGIYILIRYGLSHLFKRWSVHRGMFHSVPALFIAGLAFYLGYRSPTPHVRLLLAGGVMLGFLSHLILDELCSVDFMGLHVRLNKYAGSALKLTSRSWSANAISYGLLALLGYLAWIDWQG